VTSHNQNVLYILSKVHTMEGTKQV